MNDIQYFENISVDTLTLQNEYSQIGSLRQLLDQQKKYLAELGRDMRLIAERFDDISLPPEETTLAQRDELVALERELAEITALITPVSAPRTLRARRWFV